MTIALLTAFGRSAIASSPPHRHPPGVVPRACAACNDQLAKLSRELRKLYNSRDRGDREEAAEDLAKYSWRNHPKVVDALVSALLRDPHGEVREEAARSLGRLAPGLPHAHLALLHTARADRDKDTRREAARALRALPHPCIEACSACDRIDERIFRQVPPVRIEVSPPAPIHPPLVTEPILEPTEPPPPPPQPGPFETRKVAPKGAELVPPLPEPPLESPAPFPPLVPPSG